MQLEDEANAQFDDIVKDKKIVVLHKVNGGPVKAIEDYILWDLYSIWKKGFTEIIGTTGKLAVLWCGILTWSCWRGRLVKLNLLSSQVVGYHLL